MGVHGLWQLLQPAGRPVSLESLEGKVLAVDVSIWLHQTMKGMRDKDGNPLPNAHLQGLYSRVCKLLFYRIKPVFVFDGGVPVLKKKTLAARRDRRVEAERESSEVAQKLLQNLVKSQAVKQALADGSGMSSAASSTSTKPARVPGVRKGRNQKDLDIFELEPLPECEEKSLHTEAEQWERDFEQQENWIKEGLAALSDTHPDADEFKSLPAEIQHEILRELKERKKYHSLTNITKLPEDSEDFSSFQIKNLMKKGRLTTRMDELSKQMTNQTAREITSQLAEEESLDVRSKFGDQVEARRIVSEDAAHYVLIKGIGSVAQMEQAGRYHLERTVKKEEVDSDSEYGGGYTGSGGGHVQSSGENKSPEKSTKGPVKVLSTDDSDSDVEAVVAGRMRRTKGLRRQKGKSVAGRKTTRESQRKAAGAAVVELPVRPRVEEAVGGKNVSDVSDTSSEDEGFIEVTVDPLASMEEDELFPASIFEQPAQPVDDLVEKRIGGKTKATEKGKNTGRSLQISAQTIDDLGEKGVCRETHNPVAEKRKNTDDLSQISSGKYLPLSKGSGSKEIEKSVKAGSDNRETLMSPSKHSEKSVAGTIPDGVKIKQEEVKSVQAVSESSAAKRKSVLSDILGQLAQKKKKLEDEVAGSIDDVSSFDTLIVESSPDAESKSHDVESKSCDIDDISMAHSVGNSHISDQKTSADADFLSEGGFIRESSSESEGDEAETSSPQRSVIDKTSPSITQTGVSRSFQHNEESSEDSDASDGDLRLAKQLSLQTQNSAAVVVDRDEQSESDEDLKLAIQLSLQGTNSGSGSNSPNKVAGSDKGDRDVDEQGSGSTNELHKFDDVETAGSTSRVNKETDAVVVGEMEIDSTEEIQQASSSLNVSKRFQPEDFEVDDDDEDEDERREFVPAISEMDLHDMREELDSERSALLSQQGRQNRMATSVTEQINLDAQDLLRLFGVPFIVSPVEAEAQCAFLEAAGLTQGTITDDSDFWLFGGQRMYKNFFNQRKHVEVYTMDNIYNHFKLSREQLINIALLCGSDYTEGIQGVGPVRALEIMAEFPGEGLDGLYKFREWWDEIKKKPGLASTIGNKLRARLINLSLIPGFPSEAVVDAYLHPSVDDSMERFSWAAPDLDMLRDFCKHKFGWSKEKADQTLVMMYKEWTKTQSQGRIQSYFAPEAFVQTSKIKSNRLRKALDSFKNPQLKTGEKPSSAEQSNGKKPASKRQKKNKVIDNETNDNGGNVDESIGDTEREEVGLKKAKKATKSSSKKIRFDDKIENSSATSTKKGDEGTSDDNDALRGNKDEDFMTRMSKKVKNANQKLKDTEEARKFACVVNKIKEEDDEGNSESESESKGDMETIKERESSTKQKRVKEKTSGKVARGGKVSGRGGKTVGGSVPISLDVASSRRRSQRGGKGKSVSRGRGRAAVCQNVVNLSESSSNSDESDDGVDDDAIASKVTERRDVGLKRLTAVSKALTPNRKNMKDSTEISIDIKDNSDGKSGKEIRNFDGDADKKTGSAMKTAIAKKSKSKSEVKNPSINGESNSETKERKIPSGEGEKSGNVIKTVKKDSVRIPKKNEDANERGSHSKELARKIQDVKDTKKVGDKKEENDGQDIEPAEDKEKVEEVIDMSKADVSIINRQNLKSTMAYLNQRSCHDKSVLNQISGRRPKNAIERRMEEEEKKERLAKLREENDLGRMRDVSDLGRKKSEKRSVDNEKSRSKSDASGLSFEDVLGGGDVGVVSKSMKRKTTKTEDKQRKSREATHAKDKVRKEVNKNIDKKSVSPAKKLKLFIENITREEKFNSSVDVLDTIDARNVDGYQKSVHKQQSQENFNINLKSKRSRAFDVPIGSPPTSPISGSFTKQLRHLHDEQSVKGHGPFYKNHQQLPVFVQETGRAVAGKGKGRGKNRQGGQQSSSSGGGFLTQLEKDECEGITLDDFGSDFSDEGF